MGKRDGQFVTLRQLREEVGNDACRLFYLMRSHDQHLDFDLELAKSRSNDNPVYYIQYAHARVASVHEAAGRARPAPTTQARRCASLARLDSPQEQARAHRAGALPGRSSRRRRAARAAYAGALPARARQQPSTPGTTPRSSSSRTRALRNARLALALGVQQVVRNGLGAARRLRAGEHVSGCSNRRTRMTSAASPRATTRARAAAASTAGAGANSASASAPGCSSRWWSTSAITARRPRATAPRPGPTSARAQRRATLATPATPRPRRKARMPAPAATTSTSCCRSSRSWCRRRNATARASTPPRASTGPACTSCRPAPTATSTRPSACARNWRARTSSASVQRVAVDADVWHRVRIGPIQDLAQLNRLRQQLQAADIDTLVIRVGD